MERRRFKPGDKVRTSSGNIGVVVHSYGDTFDGVYSVVFGNESYDVHGDMLRPPLDPIVENMLSLSKWF